MMLSDEVFITFFYSNKVTICDASSDASICSSWVDFYHTKCQATFKITNSQSRCSMTQVVMYIYILYILVMIENNSILKSKLLLRAAHRGDSGDCILKMTLNRVTRFRRIEWRNKNSSQCWLDVGQPI